MCNINLILRYDKKQSRKLVEYMNVASQVSFKNNGDGEGMFLLDEKQKPVYMRNVGKLIYQGKAWFLSTHQRLSTGGDGENNCHPHPTKHLLIQHNGVFSGLGTFKNSDTREYADMLENLYVKHDKNLLKAVQEISKEVSGSYSIVIYEKLTKKVYYYKNNRTSMYYVKGDGLLIMSTIKENIEYAQQYFDLEDRDIKTPTDNVVYDVLDGFRMIGKFQPKTVTYYSGYNSGYANDSYGWSGKSKYDHYSKEDLRLMDDLETDEYVDIEQQYLSSEWFLSSLRIFAQDYLGVNTKDFAELKEQDKEYLIDEYMNHSSYEVDLSMYASYKGTRTKRLKKQENSYENFEKNAEGLTELFETGNALVVTEEEVEEEE